MPTSGSGSGIIARDAAGRFPALDGLRAVAVGIVMAFHIGLPVPGDLGVSVFFVLSGFLITWLLHDEFAANGTVSLRRFYARRTLRIFPAYYVFLLVTLVASWLLGGMRPAAEQWAAAGYVINYYHAVTGTHEGGLAHTWSLAVEEQFYLLWPALFLLVMRGRRTALAAVLGLLIAAVLLWRSWLFAGAHVGTAWVYNAFDCRFDNLAVGCLLATLLRRPRIAERVGALAPGWWAPLPLVALLAWSRLATTAAYHYTVGFTVDALLIALLLVQFMQLTHTAAWRWLEHPLTRWLGILSYPLYLYHMWGAAFGRHATMLPTPLRPVVSVAAAIGLASCSYYLVEQPFLRLKKRFAPSLRVVAPPAARTG